MKIVIIGGTGLIGSKVVSKLREQGNEAVAAAPNTGVNTLTGEGLADALEGAAVVTEVTKVAVGAPINGMVEIGGPEQFRLDEVITRYLAARGDSRSVIADPSARYSGAMVAERSLVPVENATLAGTRFEDWLSTQFASAPA